MKGYLDYLFWDSRQVELRCEAGRKWLTGWFDNVDALRVAAMARQDMGNLYTSLHRPVDRHVSNTMSGAPLKDAQVERFTRLFFDFDPVRETGTAATDEQVELAKAKAEGLVKVLRLLNWPAPLQAASGNGWHLQYRVALPNGELTRDKLRTLYKGLAAEFSDEAVKFDPTVRSPGQICRLYGSINTKSGRRSKVWVPRQWRQVRPRHLDAVCDFYARQTVERSRRREVVHQPIDGSGDYSTLDVVAWFSAHGQYLQPTGEAGKHWVRCPWEAEHSDGYDAQVTDTVIWEADGGWPTFHCSHAHCEGRTIREVLNAWGDADAFCSQSWKGGAA